MAPNFDDDDFYDPNEEEYGDEGGDELSPEDRASMTKGTADVRKALGGDANKVTVKQIEDALWHYYYDVEKSVAFLQKSFINTAPKPTPKKAPEGKSIRSFYAATKDIAFFADDAEGSTASAWSGQSIAQHHASKPLPPSSRADFFNDMPWLQTSPDRQSTFHEPNMSRGGLLGGSGSAPKMSKLQALAAARKKKVEEKKASDQADQAENDMQNLSLSEPKRPTTKPSLLRKPKQSEDEPSAKRQAVDAADPPQTGKSQYSAGLDGAADVSLTTQPSDSPAPSGRLATPSAFAKTLVGSSSATIHGQRQDVFDMPYTSSSSFLASAFTQPSPDDVVLAAQAKAGKKTTAPSTAKKAQKSSSDDTAAGDVSTGISNLKITDIPAPKSKGYDVIKEYEKSNMKKTASFVVVGHVDAGKSTLMGRLLVELKYVEERTVEKYRRQAEKSGKQSFALAWVMDQRSEERERGVTIDIATNYFETEKTKFTILDAPGHQDFVPNMIAGASQADFAILVIDANTGAYEKGLKGQTKEHVLLLRSLGLQRIIVAVNKLDMVGWSKDRFDDINQEVMGFLTGLGFQAKNVDFIPISGLNGDNIVKPIEADSASWYKGNTLIQALEAYEPVTSQAIKKPFRMAVSEIFRSQQQGTTTLAGRIDAGTIQVGDALLIQPNAIPVYVKSVVIDKDSQEWAVVGQNVSLGLSGPDPLHVRVGDILCPYDNPIICTDTITIKAMAFEHIMPMPIDLHKGRLHIAGSIVSMVATLDKATGEVIKKKPKVIQPGGVARILIKLGEKVPLEAGQRVVIRSSGETIAAGLLE